MAISHTVRQGEHLSRIAVEYGFHDYRSIWDHPENTDLKEKRESPNVLFPGDRLFIPDKTEKTESRPTGQRHRFKVLAQKLMLRLVVKDINQQPIADTPCELHVDGTIHQLTTDGDGMIEQRISKTAEHCRITILDREVPIEIGHLDPPDEVSGCQARLNNLGYNAGTSNDINDPQLRSAIEEFQCDQNLSLTGTNDAETQIKLKEIHGC